MNITFHNDGYYISKRGTVLEQFEDTITEYPMSDRYAQDIVTTSNSNIQTYHDSFAESVVDEGRLKFHDWINYQEGLMPYIREAAETVHRLHKVGYTDYRINMQSGLIH